MPISNIPINLNSAQGPQLKNLLSSVWLMSGQATQILAQMQNQNDGSNYATLETQWGIPTGQGSAVYSLLFSLANGNSTVGTGFGSGAFTQFMNRLN